MIKIYSKKILKGVNFKLVRKIKLITKSMEKMNLNSVVKGMSSRLVLDTFAGGQSKP
jgi:hypothetical protein